MNFCGSVAMPRSPYDVVLHPRAPDREPQTGNRGINGAGLSGASTDLQLTLGGFNPGLWDIISRSALVFYIFSSGRLLIAARCLADRIEFLEGRPASAAFLYKSGRRSVLYPTQK